jgi:hypothetical protein
VVEVTGPDGSQYSIQYVGIGHPWHTISNGRGRVSTGAEYALAKALIEEKLKTPIAIQVPYKGETLTFPWMDVTRCYLGDTRDR